MQTRIEEQVSLSYNDGLHNLRNGLKSYGIKISAEENDYGNYQHPLERIVMDLVDAKSGYASFAVSKQNTPKQALAECKAKIITPTRKMINNAITTLSVAELSRVTVNAGKTKKDSLVCILAEAGEIALFKSVFIKLKEKLTRDDLIYLYAIFHNGYEGSRVAEQLGLSQSLLRRGNLCYVTMAEWMLEQIDDNNSVKFIAEYLEVRNINAATELPLMLSNTSAMTLESFQNKSWAYANHNEEDEAKVKFQAVMMYDRFVSQHEGKNLFLSLTHNRLLNIHQPKESLSSNFFLDIISSKQFKVALLVILLVAGFAALSVGTLGVAGIIAEFTGAAAITVAAAGVGALGMTTGLAMKGFFASQPKTEPNEIERENDFIIGATV